jgi:single-stranded DNA-binding protein
LRYGLGVQVIHAFLSQAFAHVQANPVGSFLRRGFQLYAGLRVTTRKYQANQGHRRRQPMLFHAISLFMRLKGNRVKPRAYQAATTNGYRHESRKLLISSGVLTHFRNDTMKILSA